MIFGKGKDDGAHPSRLKAAGSGSAGVKSLFRETILKINPLHVAHFEGSNMRQTRAELALGFIPNIANSFKIAGIVVKSFGKASGLNDNAPNIVEALPILTNDKP